MFYFIIGTLISLFTLILCTVIIILKKYDAIGNVPGPTWLEMLKLFFLQNKNKDIYKYLLALPEKYGPVVKLWLKPFPPALLVADPKFFEHVLGSREHLHKTFLYDLLHGLGGDGLATIKDVTKWKVNRKLLSNVFSHKIVSNYSLKFKHHLDKLGDVLNSYENKAVDIHFVIRYCVISIIVDYLTQEALNGEEAAKIIKSMDRNLELVQERAYSVYKSNNTIFKFTKGYKTWVETANTTHDVIENVLKTQIELRRNKPKGEGESDLLGLLIESGLPRDSIIDELKTFILAGYDTSATVISFALFEIAKRPDIQENILQEYLSIIGPNNERDVTYFDLQKMTYTETVVKETLRMYPPAPLIQRRVTSAVTIDGLTIPPDLDIIFSIPSLHNLHFPRPTEFDPNRFSSENLSKIRPYTYAPFSAGSRDCIGRRFAMIEMKSILSYIVRHFTLHPVQPEHQLELVGEFTLKSKNGIPIILKRRK